jgi:hypothetical protein
MLVVNALLTIALSERFGLSVATIEAIFFVTSLRSAMSYFVAVVLARRFGLVNTMVFTHLPSNLFLVLTAFAPTIWIAVGLLVLRGVTVPDGRADPLLLRHGGCPDLCAGHCWPAAPIVDSGSIRRWASSEPS